MAISRSQMQRQLQNRGGITNLSPRQNFGLGSSLKKFVRKIIPNEVSKVATAAAPFVAPFNPLLAAGMAGIGSFDQTGSMSDALKRGALTYGGGQLARYVGGGAQNLQTGLNPFAGYDASAGITRGLFTSPIDSGGGLGQFFSKPNAPISGVKGIDQEAAKAISTDIAETGMELRDLGMAGQPVGGADPGTFISPLEYKQFTPQGTETTFIESIKTFVDPKIPVSEKGGKALDLLKKGGKAVFTKEGKVPGTRVLDKSVLFGTLGFALSYGEAKKLANEVGEDITEDQYDEARKAEKQEQYANDLQNFFAGKKDGGRIGFDNGGIDMIALEKNVLKYPEMINEITDIEPGVAEPGEPVSPESTIFMRFDKEKEEADMLQELLRELEADGGRIGFAGGTKPSAEENTPSQEIIDKQIEQIKQIMTFLH